MSATVGKPASEDDDEAEEEDDGVVAAAIDAVVAAEAHDMGEAGNGGAGLGVGLALLATAAPVAQGGRAPRGIGANWFGPRGTVGSGRATCVQCMTPSTQRLALCSQLLLMRL
mmetsp:Transcript_52882/g.112911  ORF Transcript_52882/g.112911 Transcript_52882/m.112911 type:complete len:113 (-) Transcript_52882:1108-1446(-)